MDVQDELLKEYNVNNISIIHLTGKADEFYGKMSRVLYQKYKYNNAYKVYVISLNEEYMKIDYEKNHIKTDMSEERSKLNETVLNTINETAQKKYNSNQEEWKQAEEQIKQAKGGLGEIRVSKKEVTERTNTYKFHNDYVEKQKKLAEKLIAGAILISEISFENGRFIEKSD